MSTGTSEDGHFAVFGAPRPAVPEHVSQAVAAARARGKPLTDLELTEIGANVAVDGLAREIDDLKRFLASIAQIVHQGYHTDLPGTWRECPRDVCSSIKGVLGEEEKL